MKMRRRVPFSERRMRRDRSPLHEVAYLDPYTDSSFHKVNGIKIEVGETGWYEKFNQVNFRCKLTPVMEMEFDGVIRGGVKKSSHYIIRLHSLRNRHKDTQIFWCKGRWSKTLNDTWYEFRSFKDVNENRELLKDIIDDLEMRGDIDVNPSDGRWYKPSNRLVWAKVKAPTRYVEHVIQELTGHKLKRPFKAFMTFASSSYWDNLMDEVPAGGYDPTGHWDDLVED